MKLIVTSRVGANIREKATTESRIISSAGEGMKFDASKKLTGQKVNGNDQWYELTVGGYLWSGAVSVIPDYPALNLKGQRDWRWSWKKLARGPFTIGSHGCLLTAYSCFTSQGPDTLNTRLLNSGGFMWSLIIHKVACELIGKTFGGLAKWDAIQAQQQAKKHGGTIFFLNPRPYLTVSEHWMIYLPNGKVFDPWTNKERVPAVYGTNYQSYIAFL